MKTCSKCGEEKPRTEFHKDRHRSDGLCSWCKLCNTARATRWRRANPDKARESDLRRYSGISVENYNYLLDRQAGVCAICHRPETAFDSRLKVVRRLSADHDHKTGRIRGLLCHKCNGTLGNINDDPKMLLALGYYLESHKDDRDIFFRDAA